MTSTARRRYFHAIEGRIRVAVEGVKGHPFKALAVEAEFIGMEGISKVSANPKTGNVLVLYDIEKTSHDEVVDRLRDLGYLQDAPRAIASSPSGGEDRGRLVKKLASIVACTAAELAVKRAFAALI